MKNRVALLFNFFLSINIFSCSDKTEVKDYGPIEVYSTLYNNVHTHLMQKEVCDACPSYSDGDLLTDFGDGAAYAPALFYSLKKEGRATADEMRVADEMTERVSLLIDDLYEKGIFSFIAEALQDPLTITEVFVGVAGIFMAFESNHENRYHETVTKYFEAMRPVIDRPDSQSFEAFLKTNLPWYGPTTLYAGLSGLFLQYPFSFRIDAQDAGVYSGVGEFILNKLEEKVFDPEKNNYKYMDNPSYTFIYQYSNVTVIQGLVRAYIYTQDESYLNRARDVMEALERLWSEEYKGYYSAEDDPVYFSLYDAINPQYRNRYIPLSGSNYMIYANLLMYQVTGDERYKGRIEKIFDFIENVLYHDGIVWHDIESGKLSERYCSGCNFQLLYNIYLYDRLLKGKEVLKLE